MTRRPTGAPLCDPLFPFTTLFLSRWFGRRRVPAFDVAQAVLPRAVGPALSPLGSSAAASEAGAVGPSVRSPSPRSASRDGAPGSRSEEHTSELQSLMRISYAVFCLKKTNTRIQTARSDLS